MHVSDWQPPKMQGPKTQSPETQSQWAKAQDRAFLRLQAIVEAMQPAASINCAVMSVCIADGRPPRLPANSFSASGRTKSTIR